MASPTDSKRSPHHRLWKWMLGTKQSELNVRQVNPAKHYRTCCNTAHRTQYAICQTSVVCQIPESCGKFCIEKRAVALTTESCNRHNRWKTQWLGIFQLMAARTVTVYVLTIYTFLKDTKMHLRVRYFRPRPLRKALKCVWACCALHYIQEKRKKNVMWHFPVKGNEKDEVFVELGGVGWEENV